MDVRYKAFLLAEIDALHRQEMYRIATATRAGFSDGDGYKGFIKSLELTHGRQQGYEDNWLSMFGVIPQKE